MVHVRDAYLARQPYFQTMERFLVHEVAVHWIDTFRFLQGEVEAVFKDAPAGTLERAGGNPLFLEELVALMSTGDVRSGAQSAALPDTLRGLVAARLDGLTRSERRALEDAAVYGRQGTVEALVLMAAADRAGVLAVAGGEGRAIVTLRSPDGAVARADVGLGDDAGGVVVTWEAVRLLEALGLRPRRTIRVVGWTNEENGLRGAIAYRDQHADELHNHVLAAEIDGGVFAPFGLGVTAGDSAFALLEPIGALMAPVLEQSADRPSGIVRGGGGADISPLMAEGIPGAGFLVESSRYFWYHHTAADTADKLDPREVQRCVAAMAIFAGDIPGILLRMFGPMRNRGTTWNHDPLPVVRSLHVPQFWMIAANDTEAPPEVTVSRICALQAEGLPIDLAIYPGADHGMVLTGRTGAAVRTTGHVHDYYPQVAHWIRSRDLGYARAAGRAIARLEERNVASRFRQLSPSVPTVGPGCSLSHSWKSCLPRPGSAGSSPPHICSANSWN